MAQSPVPGVAPVRSAQYSILFQGKPACCGSIHSVLRNTKWLITSDFVERETGYCCISIENLELVRVKDIHYDQRACCCCCDCCGVITLLSADVTSPQLEIQGLPNSRDVYSKLRDAVDAKTKRAQIEIQ